MLTVNDFPTVSTREQLASLVAEAGFLPFFSSGIAGFSLRDHIDPAVWFKDGVDGPWEWKADVGVYGKLFRGKAVFMTPEWYGILACYRRDGYDFEGMYEDGLLPHGALPIMSELEKGSAPGISMESMGGLNAPRMGVISSDLRARTGMTDKASGFDQIINLLQMKCFVIPTSFEYAVDRRGNPYGWGLARYSLSDDRYGVQIAAAEERYSPKEAKELLTERVMALCPDAARKQAERLIK
ncbi:MAG: hypothetical protein J5586_01885 [Clostridia bacterium]|nr:hypothetical protein [Clostridia bacterium]